MVEVTHASASAPALAPWVPLVIKNGVSIGGLAEDERPRALVLAWAVLPRSTMSEPQVNEVLKGALAGPVRCLATDHVELRRWLVDAGWLERDGFGREYRRVGIAQLREANRPLARLWAEHDVAEWVAEQREHEQSRRAARRQAWQGAGTGA